MASATHQRVVEVEHLDSLLHGANFLEGPSSLISRSTIRAEDYLQGGNKGTSTIPFNSVLGELAAGTMVTKISPPTTATLASPATGRGSPEFGALQHLLVPGDVDDRTDTLQEEMQMPQMNTMAR